MLIFSENIFEVNFLAKNQNVIKYRRTFHFNIGFVIFFIIIIYVIFNIFSYLTSNSIAEYEVQQGRIATSNIYKGLILRDETVYHATKSGTVNYYVKSGTKIAAKDVVYSVDTNGEIAKQITSATGDGSGLSSETRLKIAEELGDFVASYNSSEFSRVYTFKEELNSEVSQTLSNDALSSLSDAVSRAQANNTFYQISAGSSGIVLYYTDGLEGVTAENFTEENLNASFYTKNTMSNGSSVKEADPVFKLVNSESWSVVIAISDELAEELNETKTVKVRFCKDNYTANADCRIWKKEGAYYLELSFRNSMIRYANERFVDVELVLNTQEGLKIPNSSITSKEFFTVPKEYFTLGDDSDTKGLLLKRTENSETRIEFVTPTIYYESETAYYIDDEEVSDGDIIQKSDSSEEYVIGKDTDSLKGVYNINKGYAVFKQINILYQNEEYTIVETKTSYGIALYDHIALDGSKISENDFITK